MEAPLGPGPGPRPRNPSPTPSLPSSWKYPPNIRAPPSIAYNPLLPPFFRQAAQTLPSKTQSQGPREPLSGASRLWISCGTSPTNLKLPCSVLMRFPRLLDPPPQGLPKLPESRRSADFQLKRPSPLRNPWPRLCLPPEQPLQWMRPSGGQSWPQSLSLAHPLLQSLPGVLGLPPAPVVSK